MDINRAYSMLNTFPDSDMDMDFIQQLGGGCWVEAFDLQSGISTSSDPFNSSISILNQNPNFYQEDDTLDDKTVAIQTLTSSSQCESFLVQGNECNTSWWIGPTPKVDDSTLSSSSSSSPSSVKNRLLLAIKHLQDSTKDRNILIQIWVPVKKHGKHVLTTTDQPFSIDPNCKSLEFYRNVSKNYQFPVEEEDSKASVGLPGRVFLGKVPEWTPDVRLFKTTEYPRKGYAKQFNVQGSIALPVFEQGSLTCLGVVEIVTTTPKINYRPELENVCKALQAVDLRSSEVLIPGNKKACNNLYLDALPEMIEVLTSVCLTNNLPLAQTWAPSFEQDKSECVSTIDSAFYAANTLSLKFHEACSEHSLLKGQGVVGQAFKTNDSCFSHDITASTKTEYPLSHHAMMSDLHAAVAVRLRSVCTGSAEFVFEFFLPSECKTSQQQNQMLTSISFSLQQAGNFLRSLSGTKLELNVLVPVKKEDSSSWVKSYMKDVKQKDKKGVKTTPVFNKKEEPQEYQYFETFEQDFGGRGFMIGSSGDSSSLSALGSSGGGRGVGVKRRIKSEKAISLQVLRQYFAGSLKDAAKNIGVCPTTLKRICRQHGIARWPSRKIKKVGHSLRKLQLVMDSVQGPQGAIQIGNFYSNYPELSPPNTSGFSPLSSLNMSNAAGQLMAPRGQEHGGHASSSCSQSSDSSLCYSTVGKNDEQPQQQQVNVMMMNSLYNEDSWLRSEDLSGTLLKRARSEAELHVPKHEETRALARSLSHLDRDDYKYENVLMRVKVSFGEEKIRLSLQQNWGLRELREEIGRRVSVLNDEEVRRMNVKYLDDDYEWILMACDEDLEECIDVYKKCKRHTIKLRLQLGSS